MIPIGVAIGLYDGRTWSQAAPNAILGSLAGLASWVAYHQVCRQNNGLIIVGSFFAAMMRGRARPVGLFWIFWLSLATVIGLLVGAWARWRDGDPARP